MSLMLLQPNHRIEFAHLSGELGPHSAMLHAASRAKR